MQPLCQFLNLFPKRLEINHLVEIADRKNARPEASGVTER
jgi:hypothetical protein